MTAPRISAKSNENMDVIPRLLLLFPEISGNIKFPESLEPYMWVSNRV